MAANLWSVMLLIVIIVLYVVAKVRYYIRKSDAQWQKVDKSKLVDWDDEE